MDFISFELFKFYFHLGLIMTPHVLYDHMIYVCSLSYVSFFTWSHGQEKSLLYYDLFDFGVSILWTHPHLHFLLPLLPPHPYTCHQDPCKMGQSGKVYVTAPTYGEEEDPGNMVEDYVQPKLGPAKVRLVLPSNPSVWQDAPDYQEPLPDQARFGRQ